MDIDYVVSVRCKTEEERKFVQNYLSALPQLWQKRVSEFETRPIDGSLVIDTRPDDQLPKNKKGIPADTTERFCLTEKQLDVLCILRRLQHFMLRVDDDEDEVGDELKLFRKLATLTTKLPSGDMVTLKDVASSSTAILRDTPRTLEDDLMCDRLGSKVESYILRKFKKYW